MIVLNSFTHKVGNINCIDYRKKKLLKINAILNNRCLYKLFMSESRTQENHNMKLYFGQCQKVACALEDGWINYAWHHMISGSSILWLAGGELATIVEGDPKAPFSIATTPRCRGGRYSIPWIAPLYPWTVPYNAEC